MTAFAQRANTLADAGAPPLVQSMIQGLDLLPGGHPADQAASAWLAVAELAAREDAADPFVLMPEVRQLLQLDAALPAGFGIARPAPAAASAPATGTLRVARTYESVTPWLHGAASFAKAAELADSPKQWAIGAPQIQVPDDPRNPTMLSPDGWLWRARLRKQTNLLLPLAANLVTRETVQITADGRDRAGGRGWRRYRHFLHHAETGPGLVELTEDSGWIDLCGTAQAVQLRISKRVTVLLPQALEAKYGAILPAALSTLLWMWGVGFLKAVAPPRHGTAPSQRPPVVKLPAEPKTVTAQPDGDGGHLARVAVLGGGPAGMACAWLLSRPALADGSPAWTPPTDRQNLAVQVTLVEKQKVFGGKAASVRDPDTAADRRIKEHGLHVLMGCYCNLLHILRLLGAEQNLVDRVCTRIPSSGADPSGVTLELQPWPREDQRVPLARWIQQARDSLPDLRFLQLPFDLRELWLSAGVDLQSESRALHALLFRMGHALQQPRPLLRLAMRLWAHVARVAPVGPDERLTPQSLQRLQLQLLLKRLALAELAAVSEPPAHLVGNAPAVRLLAAGGPGKAAASAADMASPELVEPLADLLRGLARAALPATSPHADVRLARELIELATTVAIGLAKAGLFPNWAIGRPDDPLADDYTAWARAVQGLDTCALDAWLLQHGAEPCFPGSSRLLEAVTSGLFTRPAGIAAGTFVHGLLRLLFTYDTAPYRMLKGGTDQAVIEPLRTALHAQGVVLQPGRTVCKVVLDAAGAVKAVDTADADGGLPQALQVDAAVIAMPPFEGALERLGLPSALPDALQGIGHVATVSIQHWTRQAARFPGLIVSGYGAPMRCVAAMDHLQGDEGSNVVHAPVYYCGELDKAQTALWDADLKGKSDAWLQAHAAAFQDGATLPDPYPRLNHMGSDRYVCADPGTQQARRDVYATGVPNLWLAGDWTVSSFACGSIEAAVTSGLEAARHLLWKLGCDVHFPIVGPMFDKETS